jgi:hypothetical protein
VSENIRQRWEGWGVGVGDRNILFQGMQKYPDIFQYQYPDAKGW